jgi:N-hydroxyarylamine O-acetyltransferase
MDRAAYFRRIGYRGPESATLAVLSNLHRAHVTTVPFENLAIHEGQRICIEVADLVQKVIHRRRGGYCFELNGLFVALLEDMGFRVERLLGRVWFMNASAPLPTHQVTRVIVEGQAFLCDVGFGARVPREPLPWIMDAPAQQRPDTFRLMPTDNGETMLQCLEDGSWVNLYSLLPCTVRPQDYRPANHYTSTHPDSNFLKGTVVARCTEDGRVTLRDRGFRRVTAAGVEARDLQHPSELGPLLAAEFGLTDWTDLPRLQARIFG